MICATFTGGVNAWTLKHGLEALGQSLEVFGGAGDLLSAREGDPAPGATLFFTEERSLERCLALPERGYRHYPRRMGWPVDDKLEFAMHATRAGVEPVPSRALEEGPGQFPAILKARYSWRGARRLNRGFIVRSPDEARRRLDELAGLDLRSEWFFWQRYVEGAEGQCWSVSGFWDSERPQRRLSLVTRKVLNLEGALGTGLAVVTVPDPADLTARTARLLDFGGYQGPFEVEFLRDPGSGAWWVLEINPRFWLQHGLFVHARGNGLIRRYLDLDLAEGGHDARDSHSTEGEAPWLWVDGTMAAHAFLRDRAMWRRLSSIVREHRRKGGRVCRYPDSLTSWSWLVRGLWTRLKRKASGSAAATPGAR